MNSFERRKYTRTLNNFKIKMKLERTFKEVEGVTQNLSQGGAFIRSSSWQVPQKDEQAEMQLFLPPEFTGQSDTLTLTGPAVIKRVEQDKQGVAVEFLKELKTFSPSL
jgi:c-di-GMP-binding flagellar brake protein YcgR